MDSFSKTSKLEIIDQQLEPVCCGVPFLFGLFLCSGSYDEYKNVEITSDIEPLNDFIIKIIKNIFKNYKKIQEKQKTEQKELFFDVGDENKLNKLININNYFKINNKTFYKIVIEKNILPQIFTLFGVQEEFSAEENINLVTKNIEELKAFVKGVYLGSATSSIKISEKPNEKTSSGYHLEFSSKNMILLRELSHLLAQFDICAKLISRKKGYVLYIKDAENVSDLLALVGANNSVLTLKNEIVKREFRNKINRQTNCVSGNISKTVDASIKQLQAIEKIDKTIGLNALPPDLEEIALMRLANPEEPLAILLKLSNLSLTKSGLNHRLRKIISIADKLNK